MGFNGLAEKFCLVCSAKSTGGGGRCHNLKNGKEVIEVTEGKSSRMRWRRYTEKMKYRRREKDGKTGMKQGKSSRMS